eukprot:CAMPEP_0185571924 /NCGR_PEP_ID=MMETSP0434-20130131/3917_1 /TAXON_ID=626734 ORGANISM="Favella taraikaensis, Strain Fe Narragansett Bay" /NCGR_SAMPLE_ID=MMETSP0434 /ASSEMBLY_ACC=CAM_ASM_000379 /LENGTH=98 /DNA_ID=CAMNT_0028187567 /DNA_START=368 /DNA_END=664 /DNA_ORIENTATION=+
MSELSNPDDSNSCKSMLDEIGRDRRYVQEDEEEDYDYSNPKQYASTKQSEKYARSFGFSGSFRSIGSDEGCARREDKDLRVVGSNRFSQSDCNSERDQ